MSPYKHKLLNNSKNTHLSRRLFVRFIKLELPNLIQITSLVTLASSLLSSFVAHFIISAVCAFLVIEYLHEKNYDFLWDEIVNKPYSMFHFKKTKESEQKDFVESFINYSYSLIVGSVIFVLIIIFSFIIK